MITEHCGPHCGVNERGEAHCKGCHAQRSHGNARRRNGQWVAR